MAKQAGISGAVAMLIGLAAPCVIAAGDLATTHLVRCHAAFPEQAFEASTVGARGINQEVEPVAIGIATGQESAAESLTRRAAFRDLGL
jgi:hypothetical protein